MSFKPYVVAGVMLVSAGTPSTTVAKTGVVDRVARCALLKDAGKRLACFDELSADLGVGSSEDGAAKVEKWILEEEVDPLNDTKMVSISMGGDPSRKTLRGPPMLVLQCRDGRSAAMISWDEYLGSEAHVTVRVGKESAESKSWNLSHDRTATFYPRNPVAFMKRLADADRLAAQVKPYNTDLQTVVFDLTGIAKALLPVASACGWKVRGDLGVRYGNPTDSQLRRAGLSSAVGGAIVLEVEAGSLAAKAGLAANDLIVGLNGSSLADATALKALLEQHDGDLTLDVVRGRKHLRLSLRL